MRYYLDTEFNGMGGELISLALVREDGLSLYLVVPCLTKGDADPWVADNVLPILWDVPKVKGEFCGVNREAWAHRIADFMANDHDPVIVTDWPDDIAYFCKAVITGPGQMADIPGLKFEMHRVDAYPTSLEGAIQHNALWDAMALKAKVQGL
jgi:hypothetical protein